MFRRNQLADRHGKCGYAQQFPWTHHEMLTIVCSWALSTVLVGIHGRYPWTPQDVGFILLKGCQPASGEQARQQAAGVGGQRSEGVRDQSNEWKGPVLSSVPVTSRNALDQVDKAIGTPRSDFLGAFHFPAHSIHGARWASDVHPTCLRPHTPAEHDWRFGDPFGEVPWEPPPPLPRKGERCLAALHCKFSQ